MAMSAPTSSLLCRSFEFMPLWDTVVKKGCKAILENPLEKVDAVPLYNAVYRLASNKCTKVPVLIRGSQNEKVETRDVTAQQCLVLYYLLRELLKEHLEKDVLSPTGRLCAASDADLVPAYVDAFYKMSEALRRLKSVFNYLQNHWHTLHMHNTNIFFNVISMGYNMWNDHVVQRLKPRLGNILVRLYFGDLEVVAPVTTTPSEFTPAQDMIREISMSFNELDQYVSHSTYAANFDGPLRDEIANRYRLSVSFKQSDLFESLKSIHAEVAVEVKRAQACAYPTTVNHVREVILNERVVSRIHDYLAVAMDVWLVGTPNIEALTLLNSALAHSQTAMKILKEHISRKVYSYGSEIVKKAVSDAAFSSDVSVDFKYIDALVNVCMALQSVATKAFGPDLIEAFEAGMRRLINNSGAQDSTIVSKCLARYLHVQLVCGRVTLCSSVATNSSSVHAAQTLDESTEVALFLFGLSEEVDAFQVQYHNALARRLLCFEQVSVEIERVLVMKIGRITKSKEYIHRFEKMLYEYSSDRISIAEIKFVACLHYWPWQSKVSHRFNARPIDTHPAYATFWPALNASKKQKTIIESWLPGVSFTTIQTNPKYFTRGGSMRPIDVKLSHAHTVILLQLQNITVDKIDFKQICETYATGFGDSASPKDLATAVMELSQIGLIHFEGSAMVSVATLLSTASVHLLMNVNYNPIGDEVDMFTDSTLFPLDERSEIEQCLTGVHVAGGAGVMNISGNAKTSVGSVLKDATRKILIQTHIVKIVKSKGVIKFAELIKEVSSVLSGRFVPDISDIKTEMESLIGKDFLERDSVDPELIRHVA